MWVKRRPQHAAEKVAPASLVVNPAMRRIEKKLRKERRQAGKLLGQQARLRGRRAEVGAEFQAVERQITGLERTRDSIDSDVPAGELDPALRLETLPEPRRSCWDGLPMIAYGAETLVAATEGPKVGEAPTVRRFVNVLL